MIIGNNYTQESQIVQDLEAANYNLNKPYNINLTDDASWRSLNIDSSNGTVCSYRLQNRNAINNDYQIGIKQAKNVEIGLYFYSEFWSQIVDYKVFDASYCNHMKYC